MVKLKRSNLAHLQRLGPQRGQGSESRAFTSLIGKSLETIEGRTWDPVTILRDRVVKGAQDRGREGEGGIHTEGLQWDVVKQQMGRRIRRVIGQDLQVDLDPGDGLEEKSRSTR